jgi:hypothetical protein
MPYDPSKQGSVAPAADPVAAGGDSDPPNPFFQFIDPSAHRQLVEGALGRTEAGRLITPLSRVRQRKGGSTGLGSAWDEELADDAA